MAADVLFRMNVLATLTKAFDLAPAKSDLTYAKETHLTDGTGANQASNLWHDTRSVLTAANDDLDLYGPLTDVFGTAMLFTRIKLLAIYSQPTNTTVLSVGGAASHPWSDWAGGATHTVKVRPGGMFLTCAPDATGFAIVDGATDVLRIANAAGATAVYDIIIAGTM